MIGWTSPKSPKLMPKTAERLARQPETHLSTPPEPPEAAETTINGHSLPPVLLDEAFQLSDGIDRDSFREFFGSPSDLPGPDQIHSIVAFDTETSQLHPDDGATVSVISIAWLDSEGVIWATAYPFGQGPEGQEQDLGPDEWATLLQWLATAPHGLVGHNSKFDVLQLANCAKPGYPGRNLNSYVRYDTMVGAREFWPEYPAALKQIGVRLFEADADAEQRALKPYLGPKSNMRYDLVPWEVMQPYAIQDAVLTLRVYLVQEPLYDEGQYGAHFIYPEVEISAALLRMELAGIPYDAAASRKAAEFLNAEIEALSADLPFHPNKAKDFYFSQKDEINSGLTTPYDGPVLLTKGGKPRVHQPKPTPIMIKPLSMPARKRSENTGDPSLDSEVLDQLVRDQVPYAETLQKIARYKSAVSKWYEPFAKAIGDDGRLRTSFRQVAAGAEGVGGTASGRFSAGRVNLQAIPKDFHVHLPVPTPRKLIADGAAQQCPGWSLWDLDLATAELRVAALDAGCQTMIDMVNEGRDLHGETATAIFGTEPDHPDFKFNRQVAKRGNFSFIFGSGAKTFKNMVAKESGMQLTMAQSSEIVYAWRDLYPEYGNRIYYWEEFVKANGYVTLVNGKRRYYKPGEDYHSAFNQYVQGSLAEYAKRWLLYTDRYLRHLRKRGLDEGIGRGGLVLVVHDSQVLLLPDDEAEAICENIRAAGVRLWGEIFPGVPGAIDITTWDS
jgi:DNA polymerase I-like protein with 3'-5' exonuclease and polymerase domains